MGLDAIGFGSLNLDEFWEVPHDLLNVHDFCPGAEYIRDVKWFETFYPELVLRAELKAAAPGGSAANMIAALRKMGFRTGFFGAAGRADAASLNLNELGEVTDLRVQLSDLPSGRCLSMIDKDDPARDRILVVLPNANDLAGAGGFHPDYFGGCQWVHLTSFVSSEPLACQTELIRMLPAGVGVSFDPGAVYSSLGFGPLETILRRTDLLFVSEEEVRSIIGGTVAGSVESLLRLGIGTVILKRGTRGLSAFQGTKVVNQRAVPAGQVFDRTGAGDVAAAGLIAGLLKSLTLEESLELAAVTASKSIEGYGRSKYPDVTVLQEFLSSKFRQ